MLQLCCIVQDIRSLSLEHPRELSSILSSYNCGLVSQLSSLNSLVMVFGSSGTWHSDGNAWCLLQPCASLVLWLCCFSFQPSFTSFSSSGHKFWQATIKKSRYCGCWCSLQGRMSHCRCMKGLRPAVEACEAAQSPWILEINYTRTQHYLQFPYVII
jgi:hypothetical protein